MAMPVLTIATMPLAAVTLILMPFGLEPLSLMPMGYSIDAIIGISGWVSQWPQADTIIAGIARCCPAACDVVWLLDDHLDTSHPICRAGWICIGSCTMAVSASIPDILIARDGRMIGVMAEISTPKDNGSSVPAAGHIDPSIQTGRRLAAIATSRSSFTVETWLRRTGDIRPKDTPELRHIRCTASPCELVAGLPKQDAMLSIAIERYGDDIGALCTSHDVVVLPSHSPRGNPIPIQAGRNRDDPACASTLVITRDMLLRRGALALQATRKSSQPDLTRTTGRERDNMATHERWHWTIRGARDQSQYRIWSPANRQHLTLLAPENSPHTQTGVTDTDQ
jgi:hypothetical protein